MFPYHVNAKKKNAIPDDPKFNKRPASLPKASPITKAPYSVKGNKKLLDTIVVLPRYVLVFEFVPNL